MSHDVLNVAVIGSGSMGALLLDCLEEDDRWRCTSIHDDAKAHSVMRGIEVLGMGEDSLPSGSRVFVAIGDPGVRRSVVERLAGRKLDWQTYVDRRSMVARGAVVGRGTLVLPFAMMTSDASVGEFCIVNAYSRVGDGSKVGRYTSIMAGSSMGDSTAGEECLLGLNSACLAGAVLGDRVTVAPMTLVRRRVPGGMMAAGNPARIFQRSVPRESISSEGLSDADVTRPP